MVSALALSTLITLAAATPQWGPPGGGQGGPGGFGGIPSCLSSCFTSSSCSLGDTSCYCSGSTIASINSCISSSSCSDSDKEGSYQTIAQLCANTGSSVTASPEATFSVTSGGSAWPTQWTTNSAWDAALSSWKTQTTGAPGPFPGSWGSAGAWSAGSGYGPFGHGGPGNGYGPWASDSTGAWTSGPWTKWWGTGACPPSTWSGWTSGSWSASPSWTSWTACTASTTATSVVTTTVTSGSSTGVITSTSFAIKVDQSATSTSSQGSGAMPTNFAFVGSAAGVVGVLAGAVLL